MGSSGIGSAQQSGAPSIDDPLRRTRWRRAGLCAILLCLGALVFGQVRGFAFVTSDDRDLIVGNPLVHSWSSAPLRERLLTPGYGYAIPVTAASFALDAALFGPDVGRWAAGAHVFNLLLHLGNTLLVFAVLLGLCAEAPAFAGAALFLLHPVQAETVAYVTQRKDLLVFLFGGAGLLAALPLLIRDAAPTLRRGALVVGLVLLSGLCKPSGVLLGPLFAGLLLLRGRERRRLVLAVTLLGLGGALVLLQMHVDAAAGMATDRTVLPLGLRLSLPGSTLRHYLESLLVPLWLSPKVPRPVSAAALDLALGALFGLLALLATARVVLVTPAPRAQLALGWFLATYLPVANLTPLSRYAADCYLYAPLLSLALGLSIALERAAAWPRARRVALGGAVFLCVAAWTGLSVRQTALWRDEETLYRGLYALHPESREAMREYADLLVQAGRRDEGLSVMLGYYGEALRRSPDALAPRAWVVRLLLQRGRPARDGAPADVEQARSLLDGTPPAQRGAPGYHELRLEWSLDASLSRRDPRGALEALEALLRLRPDHPRRALLPTLRSQAQAPPPPAP